MPIKSSNTSLGGFGNDFPWGASTAIEVDDAITVGGGTRQCSVYLDQKGMVNISFTIRPIVIQACKY